MNVVSLKSKMKAREGESVRVAVPAQILISTSDRRNCYVESWENRNRRGAKGRCPGISTILDTNELECEIFSHSEVSRHRIYTDKSSILHEPNGEIAHWGKSRTIRRCNACVIGEQIMKQSKH